MGVDTPAVAMIGPFATYEVLIFVVLFVGLVPMTVRLRKCQNRWFYVAYLAFFAGFIASMLSTTAYALEHLLGVALAGFLFWWTGMTGGAKLRNPTFYDEVDTAEEV
jgi:hypothetical protein